ncbi:DUF2764 family protein [Candidatus Neptunichlamydia sp. REUL1]|uniref:DUF2764 family protein n=1 Tax=Candidatus Neptunichlamydia sp. REUL1 TaxID=3064277 RepID=UPI00292F1A62|nr:DUF2764 family protein [Candidatus Neptunochlamydia sp. REUL1]
MGKYFFLGSVLPPLKVGNKPGIIFEDLMTLFRDNMGADDLEKAKAILTYIDIKNVQSLLKKEAIDHRGNLNEKELDEAIVNQSGLPQYVFEHLEETESVQEQLRHFSKVLIAYFKEMEKKYRGFLKGYFRFEHEWRVLLAGYRAKKLGLEPGIELQHEDFHDPLVAQVLAQKDAPFFEFPFEYADLGEKLKDAHGKPKMQYDVMANYRFSRVGDEVQDAPFSADYLLSYLVQLIIVEGAYALNEKQGNQMLSEIVKGSI